MSVVIVFLICLFGVFDMNNSVSVEISKSRKALDSMADEIIKAREAMEKTYLKLQRLGAGYRTKHEYTKFELSRFDTQKFETLVNRQYNDILCTHVYMAIHHQRLFKYFAGPRKTQDIPKDKLFVRQAQIMITVAYSCKGISKDMMRAAWLVYTYQLYLETISKNEIELAERIFPEAHNDVTIVLQEFTEKNCRKNNIFDGFNKLNYLFRKQLGALAITPNQYSTRSIYIWYNKAVVIDPYLNGQLLALGLDEKPFSTGAIFLNRLYTVNDDDKGEMHTILSVFGEQGDDNAKRIMRFIGNRLMDVKSHYWLGEWANRMSDFLSMFVDLLKMIMLRIVCMHVVRLEHVLGTKDVFYSWSTMRDNNSYISVVLREFVEFMDLSEDDPHFKYAVDAFSKPMWNFFTSRLRRTIVYQIVGTINRFSVAFPGLIIECPTTLMTTYIDNYQAVDELAGATEIPEFKPDRIIQAPMIRNSVNTAYYYVKYIKKKLVYVDMKVFKSFVKFAENMEDIISDQ